MVLVIKGGNDKLSSGWLLWQPSHGRNSQLKEEIILMPTLTMNPLTHFHHWSYVTNKDGARKAIDIIKAEKIRETTKQWIKIYIPAPGTEPKIIRLNHEPEILYGIAEKHNSLLSVLFNAYNYGHSDDVLHNEQMRLEIRGIIATFKSCAENLYNFILSGDITREKAIFAIGIMVRNMLRISASGLLGRARESMGISQRTSEQDSAYKRPRK